MDVIMYNKMIYTVQGICKKSIKFTIKLVGIITKLKGTFSWIPCINDLKEHI